MVAEEPEGFYEGGEKGGLYTKSGTEYATKIISRNKSPDLSFDRSINPYKGCEHGCIYCFVRSTHNYWGLSSGQDFETHIFTKLNAVKLLRQELNRPRYQWGVVVLGSNTDPYQPIERRLKITRGVLEELSNFNHPVAIVTKSVGVIRDLDLISDMAKRNLAKVFLSVTTLDKELSNRLEPRASKPRRSLAAVRELSQKGVPTGVMIAPIIPGLTDSEIEAIIGVAAANGASECGYILLRLPNEVKALFTEWLHCHRPLAVRRVLNLVRAVHGGRLYNSAFGQRQKGDGPYAKMILDRFSRAAKEYSINVDPKVLDCTRFCPPQFQGELFG